MNRESSVVLFWVATSPKSPDEEKIPAFLKLLKSWEQGTLPDDVRVDLIGHFTGLFDAGLTPRTLQDFLRPYPKAFAAVSSATSDFGQGTTVRKTVEA